MLMGNVTKDKLVLLWRVFFSPVSPTFEHPDVWQGCVKDLIHRDSSVLLKPVSRGMCYSGIEFEIFSFLGRFLLELLNKY